jgi:hypothetical protein
MTDRLMEIGRCYGMRINVEISAVKRISRQPFPVHIMTDQKQLQSVEHFNCLGSRITNGARCRREINYRIVTTEATFNRKKTLFTSKLNINLREKLIKCCIWSKTLCAAEIWVLRKVGQKFLKSLKSGTGEGWRRSVEPIM